MKSRSVRLAIACLLALPVGVRAQQPSTQTILAEGIRQVRQGDFSRALITLDDVVTQTSGTPADAAMLARAHAYRAVAYFSLNQPERADTAALLALQANPNLVIDIREFSAAVVALFERARRLKAENPDAAGKAVDQARR